MSRMPTSAATAPVSERNRVHMGEIVSVQIAEGGGNPGPASYMSYTVACNDLPGPLTGISPSKQRWDDSWDVEALAPGTPVTIHMVRGRYHILEREDRAAEECP